VWVASVLTLSGVGTGAVVGLVAGVAAELLGVAGTSVAVPVVLVGTSLLADLTVARVGRPRPLSVQRQVPQTWGRLLPAPVAAFLYGARLGIGPATILTSWLWWGAALAGATLGPVPSALGGGAFGLVRGLTTIAAATLVQRSMAAGMARLRRREAMATTLGLGVVVLALLGVLLA